MKNEQVIEQYFNFNNAGLRFRLMSYLYFTFFPLEMLWRATADYPPQYCASYSSQAKEKSTQPLS